MRSHPKKLPTYWNERELAHFLSVVKRPRDRMMMYLMAYCGLRVSELCNLRIDNISWDERSIRFMGKGEKERVVPLNDQVYDFLVEFLDSRPPSNSPFVISSLKGSTKSLSRRTVYAHVNRYSKIAGFSHGHPHTLRHTFGTILAQQNVPIERIAELMGHENINTTRIYARVSAEQKRKSVSLLDSRPWHVKFFSRFSKRSIPEKVFSRSYGSENVDETIGRKTELKKLRHNLSRGVDTILTGGPGTGKSHLLKQLHSEKLIRLHHFAPVKQAVLHIAEILFESGVLNPDSDEELPVWSEFKKSHTRTTVRQWCSLILNSITFNEWILIVDDLTDTTKSAAKMMNLLNEKFIIFGALRAVKPAMEHHFWKYDRFEIGPLTRYESVQLIRHLCIDASIEDFQLFETHVLQRSACNPRAIREIVERAKKEPVITSRFSRQISHSGAVKKIDLSPVFVIIGAVLVASRFIARGSGNLDGYMFAGVGGALFMMLRFFVGRTRR
jgi:integrase/recombinase XerD